MTCQNVMFVTGFWFYDFIFVFHDVKNFELKRATLINLIGWFHAALGVMASSFQLRLSRSFVWFLRFSHMNQFISVRTWTVPSQAVHMNRWTGSNSEESDWWRSRTLFSDFPTIPPQVQMELTKPQHPHLGFTDCLKADSSESMSASDIEGTNKRKNNILFLLLRPSAKWNNIQERWVFVRIRAELDINLIINRFHVFPSTCG